MLLIAQQFLEKVFYAGYDVRITSGIRTQAEQDALYAQGRTTPGPIVTWTKNSQHVKGLAFDICFNGTVPYPTDDKKWKALADLGKTLGLKAGYYFTHKDRPHFEL